MTRNRRVPWYRRARYAVPAAVVAALVVLRLCLPAIVLREVNAKMSEMENFRGRVDGIGISLWRGAYQLRGVKLDKWAEGKRYPFFRAPLVDLAVSWRPLLHGSVVGKVRAYRPVLILVKRAEKAKPPSRAEKDELKAASDRVMPLRVDHLSVYDGEIRYQDPEASPPVEIALSSVAAEATGLTNERDEGGPLPARVSVTALCFGTGKLALDIKAAPLADQPTFELKETLDGVSLPALNDFFQAYAKVKVKSGEFELYTELAAKDGGFSGYAKPFIKNLKIDKSLKTNRSLGRKLWAELAAFVGWTLKNQDKKQVATKIPMEGRFDAPKTAIWPAVVGLLKNAFIRALEPSLDASVDLGSAAKAARKK